MKLRFIAGIEDEVLLDGENDITISTTNNDKADIKIDNDSLNGMNLKI